MKLLKVSCIYKLAETQKYMGYRSTKSDTVVWIDSETTDNGTAYYK